MPTKLQVREGDCFGAWTLLSTLFKTPGAKHYSVEVRCKCGLVKVADAYSVITGKSKGCLSCSLRTHGATVGQKQTTEYVAWSNMIQRCYNPKNNNYKRYGARGVRVCDRWNPNAGGSFTNFLQDMGLKPDPTYQLDKEALQPGSTIYSPETTRWASRKDNNRRKRTNRLLTYQGVTLPVVDWAMKQGLTRSALQHRLDRGWTVERALTTPQQR